MAHDVFISYSSRDKPIADAICANLEAAKIRCWIAPRDVLPGVPYGEALSEALHQSQILLLVFSSNSNRSAQVMREVESAVDKGIPILPFRIEDVKPTASLDYFVKAIHWLDAVAPPLEKHLESLVGTVRSLLARQHVGAADSGPTPTSPTPLFPAAELAKERGKSAAFGYLMAGVGASAVVVLLVVLAMWWRHHSATDQEPRGNLAGLGPSPNPAEISPAKPEPKASPEKTEALAARQEADKARVGAQKAGSTDDAPSLWAEAEAKNTEAVRLFDSGDFVLAKERWSAAAAGYEYASKTVAALPSAKKAQAAYEAELAKTDRKELETDGGAAWQRIVALTKSALECRKQSRFAEMADKYDEALRLLPDAQRAAKQLQAKYDAYNTGADLHTWFMWSSMAYVSKKSLKDKTAKDPKSTQKTIDDSLAIVAECLPGLRANMKRMQLPPEFCDQMLGGKDLTSQELVVWRANLYDKIKDKWGDEVAKSYSVGSMWAGLGLMLAAANLPGSPPPDVQMVLANLRDAGYGAGYPKEFFDTLDKVEAQCKAGSPKQAQHSYQVLSERMALPAAAKAFLRQPAAVPPKK